jgi:hypothetical protein
MRGFVYDAKSCYLATGINGDIVQVTKINWVSPGSFDVFRTYFRVVDSDWHEAVTAACQISAVSLEEFCTKYLEINSIDTAQCILGAGAFGRVFSVVKRDDKGEVCARFAMKIVCGDRNCEQLQKEYEIIQRFPEGAASFALGAVAGSFQSVEIARPRLSGLKIAVFLMPAVGTPFHCVEDVTNVPDILQSLSGLHNMGISHGDARYRNVVQVTVDGKLSFLWIDFLGLGSSTTFDIESDILVFFKSLNHDVVAADVKNYASKTAKNEWSSDMERIQAVRNLYS